MTRNDTLEVVITANQREKIERIARVRDTMIIDETDLPDGKRLLVLKKYGP
ncbi:hypothetical protein [Desulfovibrio inopinatus]|uniref:hypothetical protein n=1 Tax=Desulfovibrio inopinatus TaxID=102109 RepID=UPI00041DF8FC|nr:hypothetical protein [Desulfovibrio inopinatus]